MAGTENSTDCQRCNRAWLRLIFGQLQIIGATAGLYLLIETGVSRETTIVVGATLLVSICSRLVFSRKRARQPETPHTAAPCRRITI